MIKILWMNLMNLYGHFVEIVILTKTIKSAILFLENGGMYMAFEKVGKILKLADDLNTAVIALICIDYNMVRAAVEVAEERNTPIIIMLLPEHQEKNKVIGRAGFAAMVKEEAEKVKVPIGLHLDHCSDYDYIISAIKDGFTSVMVDGSMYSFEKNVELSRKVTETAHILGVEVEGELGQVGLAQQEAEKAESEYTTPDSAAKFCEETKIDCLTIAIGSAHGEYTKPPKLDIKRLKEIDAAIDIPLVLHGGSGIPHEELEKAFSQGVNKFNLGTEYLDCYYKAVEEYVDLQHGKKEPLRMLKMPGFVQNRLKEYLREKMKISKF